MIINKKYIDEDKELPEENITFNIYDENNELYKSIKYIAWQKNGDYKIYSPTKVLKGLSRIISTWSFFVVHKRRMMLMIVTPY